MPTSFALRDALLAALGIDLLLLGAGLVAAGVLMGRREGVPAWLGYVLSGSLGFALGGIALLLEAVPAVRVALLIAIGVAIVAVSVPGDRLARGGLLLVGASLPWLVVNAAAIVSVLVFGSQSEFWPLASSVAVNVIAIGFGLWMIDFQRSRDALPPGPAPRPGVSRPVADRRWDVVSALLIGRRSWLAAPVVVGAAIFSVGTLVTVTAAHGRSILETIAIAVAGIVVTGIVSGATSALLLVAPARRAFEAFLWLSEWEFDRLSSIAGTRIEPNPRELQRYVRNTTERPEDRWLRAEALVAFGDLDGARAMAERMPEDTPLERVERASMHAYLDWLVGGPGDPTALRAAVADVGPEGSLDRLRADVILALSEVRLRASEGLDDPLLPLRLARDRLGREADGQAVRWATKLRSGWFGWSGAAIGTLVVLDRLMVP